MQTPKYQALAQWACRQIQQQNMQPGQRFYSEAELCELHGVSRQTVRQAITRLVQQGVLEARQGSGTFVAEAAGMHTGGNIGVVSTYFNDYIFPGIITGIEEVLSQNGFGMQLAITHNKVQDEEKALLNLLEQNVAGLIVEPTKSALPNPNAEIYKEIESRGIPLVFFNAAYPWANFPLVAMDDVRAGRMAGQCLIEAGHTRIAALFQADDIQGHLRYKGYMQAMAAARLAADPENILWYTTEDIGDLFQSSQRVLSRLRGCTAVVCYNDQLALKLLNFCRRHDIRVPQQLSVVGVDNADLSSLCDPPLTTVAHPMRKLGQAAAGTVVEMLKTPGAVAGTIFEPELVVRQSVAGVE